MPTASVTLGVPTATLRDLRVYSADRLNASGRLVPGNGFADAFLKLGRAVYVDVVRFEEILRSQSKGGHDAA
jgi:hypothetical protein